MDQDKIRKMRMLTRKSVTYRSYNDHDGYGKVGEAGSLLKIDLRILGYHDS